MQSLRTLLDQHLVPAHKYPKPDQPVHKIYFTLVGLSDLLWPVLSHPPKAEMWETSLCLTESCGSWPALEWCYIFCYPQNDFTMVHSGPQMNFHFQIQTVSFYVQIMNVKSHSMVFRWCFLWRSAQDEKELWWMFHKMRDSKEKI